jgi:hypothetical protein
MVQDIDKYTRAGFDQCLGKPIDMNDIYSVIQKYCQTTIKDS